MRTLEFSQGGGGSGVAQHLGAAPRRFLFVTAPFGPFSRELAAALRARGATCERVLINGGDLADWGPRNARFYFAGLESWPRWIADHMAGRGVTDLITHGDSHPYAIAAIEAAKALGIAVHVFEQGYLRPHWVTLERDGVNAHSTMTRRPEDFVGQGGPPPHVELGRTAPTAVRHISHYHFCAFLLSPLFSRYRSPYAHSPPRQAVGHLVRYIRQQFNKARHNQRLTAFLGRPGPLYIVLLQRPGDSQLTRHSGFSDGARSFLWRVIGSFAAHAPANGRLLIKSHPLDHGLEDHEQNIERTAGAANVRERVLFVDDGDFRKMVGHAQAVISVNSTGGLMALEHGVPTLAMGKAIYDMPGLTHQGGLDALWEAPQAPDPELLNRYRAALLEKTQINGAFATAKGIELAVQGAVERLLSDGVQASAVAVEPFSMAVIS